MKNLLIATALVALAPALAGAETNRWERTLVATSGPVTEVCVANVVGDVVVRAAARQDVSLRVVETTRGAESLAAARSRLPLHVEPHAGGVAISVGNGPRDDDDGRCGRRTDLRGEPPIRYDLELEVPLGADLALGTVNEGRVSLTGGHGELRVHNVNGDVEVRGVAGHGSFGTVNGDLEVEYLETPAGETTFSNVNGVIDVAFPPSFAADLRIRTLNGEVWTDFPFELRPVVERERGSAGGRLVLKQHGETAARIGRGGPRLAFTTVNGDILIRNRAEGR